MYNIYINLFIVTVDLKTEKRYILSSNKDQFTIPRFTIDKFNIYRLNSCLAEFIRNIVPMHILGVLPQVISIHSPILANTYKKLELYENNQNNDLETIYGCLVDHIPLADTSYHWVEFSYEIPNDYSANIFEVCQYLR